jgi:hypothetical protein
LWRKRIVAKLQLPLKKVWLARARWAKVSKVSRWRRVLDLQHHITQHHDVLFTQEDDDQDSL